MQLYLRILFLFGFCITNLYCSAQYDDLVNKSYAERYRTMDSLFYYNKPLRDNKVLLYKALDELEEVAVAANDIELKCEAWLLRLADYSTDDNWDSAKVESYAASVLKIAQKHKLIQIEIRCRQFLGRYYMEKKGSYIAAMDEFLQSYYLLYQLPIEKFPSKKECLYNVAHAYYTFGDFEGAKKYLTEAENIKMPAHMTLFDNPFKIKTYTSLKNTLGLIYRYEGQYDSAIYYFEKVRALAAGSKDTVWIGIASGNIGICYYLQHEYEKAIPLLQDDIKNSFKGAQIDNGLNSLIKLTDIYLKKNELRTVRLLLDSARRQLDYTFEPSEHMQHLAVLMAGYYAATGNPDLAYRYMDSAMTAKQIMNEKKDAMQLANNRHKLDLQAYRVELEKVESIKRVQVLKRNSVIVFLFLITIFTIVFINRQAKLYRHKNELAESEKNRAEQDLANAAKQLQDFTMRISEKNELIMKFTDEIKQYKSLSTEATHANNNTIQELQQSTILTEEEWETFKINFEKVHIGFFNRLKEKLPELTAAEIRFMALSKLKLNNKEMAHVLGIGLSGMRNYKYRLHKKLNIEEGGSLEQFIENI